SSTLLGVLPSLATEAVTVDSVQEATGPSSVLQVSWTYTFANAGLAPAASTSRLVNATNRPSSLIEVIPSNVPVPAGLPALSTETILVDGVHAMNAPMHVSRTKAPPFGAPGKLGKEPTKLTKRPFALTATPVAPPLAGLPLLSADASSV